MVSSVAKLYCSRLFKVKLYTDVIISETSDVLVVNPQNIQ